MTALVCIFSPQIIFEFQSSAKIKNGSIWDVFLVALFPPKAIHTKTLHDFVDSLIYDIWPKFLNIYPSHFSSLQ